MNKNKQTKRIVISGQAHIKASYNNTMVTLTDNDGGALAWSSAGKMGFKGPKKSTPYAATIVVKDVVGKVRDYGLKEVNVFVKGVGGGREASVRALYANKLTILSIKDITSVPHNGCRPPKVRRV